MPMAFSSLKPLNFTASMDLKRGVFSSMHLPKWVTKAPNHNLDGKTNSQAAGDVEGLVHDLIETAANPPCEHASYFK